MVSVELVTRNKNIQESKPNIKSINTSHVHVYLNLDEVPCTCRYLPRLGRHLGRAQQRACTSLTGLMDLSFRTRAEQYAFCYTDSGPETCVSPIV